MKGLCPLSKNNNISYNKKIAVAAVVGVAALAALYFYYKKPCVGCCKKEPASEPTTNSARARTSTRSRRESKRSRTMSPHTPKRAISKAKSPTEATQQE